MVQPTENLENEVLKLPRGERAKLALHLLDSLENGQPSSSPEEIERAWIDESARRLAAYRRGEMDAYPGEDVIAELERPAE